MKIKYLLLFLIILSSISFAQETIYDLVENIKSNPNQYTLVLGGSTDNNEIKAASELSSFLGITRSRFDREVSQNQKLILIGNPSTNTIIKSLLGEWTYGDNKALIKTINNNLIIAGSETQGTQTGISVIKNYEKNKNKLQTDEYITSSFFSPSEPTFFILIGLTVLVIIAIIVVVIILIKRKKLKNSNQPKEPTLNQQQKPITQQPVQQQTTEQPQQLSPEEKQLYQYIQVNLRRGYQKQDLKRALLNSGWNISMVDKALSKFP